MFDVDVYLARLGYTGPVSPTWPILRDLHKRHLMTIPYDSALNAMVDDLWSSVDIEVDKTFAEVVVGGRGGVCTELNGLFRVLLERLGFAVEVYSGGTRQLDGSFGPDLEHVFNSVVLDGTRYLVDVGFVGPSFLEPIVLSDEPQEQYGNVFRVAEDGDYRVLLRKGRTGDYLQTYRFRPRPRSFAEWDDPGEDLREFARGLAAAGTLVRGRSFESGQRILIGRRYVVVDDGHDHLRVLVNDDEHREVVAAILGIGHGAGTR